MRWLVFLFALLFAIPASSAGWHRAESENYVVHADLGQENLRKLAQSLEDFDRLLRSQLPTQTRPGRKLHFYLYEDARNFRWTYDSIGAGRTLAPPEQPASFTRYVASEQPVFRYSSIYFAQAVYFIDHGYFRTLPPWVKTGVPAVFSTAYVNDEGDFILGTPDVRRPLKGAFNARVFFEVITTDYYTRAEKEWARFYNRSRELVRPLIMDPRNSGLLEGYLSAYNAGLSGEQAAGELGDLDQLAKRVDEFRKARRPTLRRVSLSPAEPSTISIRAMTPDEVELAPFRLARLVRADPEEIVKRLQKVIKRHPQSAEVWYEFADAEFARVRKSQFGGERVFRGFGFSNGRIVVTAQTYPDAQAWRAVNRALELAPGHAPATVLKAEILLSRLLQSNEEDETQGFEEVRRLLAPYAANPEAYPLAAAVSYQSYLEQGIEPTNAALEALGRAFAANPAVEEFRYAYASALVRAGQRDVAAGLLTSMLNNPEYRDAARLALDQVSP